MRFPSYMPPEPWEQGSVNERDTSMQRIPCVPTLQMRSFSSFGNGDCMGLGGGVGERG